MTAFFRYLRDSYDELQKVQWPTRATTVQYSLLVIGSVVIATTIFGIIDWGLATVASTLLEG
ncbi:preprotein translocase subunit SecE [Candidatus Berkelbacteria bacterium]|nr:preprotein translocase subunit SecE [Candidatus Berkelbacteria bacterium]